MIRLRHLRNAQDLIHTRNIAVDLRERFGDVHDLIQHAGDRWHKDEIENKRHGKFCQILSTRTNQNAHRHQDQIDVVDDRGKGRHTVLPAQGKFQHPFCIAADRFFKLAERRRRLVERFHHRHAANIFHRGVVHFLKRRLIPPHVLFHLAAAEADELRHKRAHNAKQRRQPEAPVHAQKDHDHHDRRRHRRHKIRKLMRDKSFHAFDVVVHDLAQTAAADRQMIAQRDFGDMLRKKQFEIVQRSERCQMGAENGQKIQQNVAGDASERQPAVSHDQRHIQPLELRINAEHLPNHQVHRDVRNERSDGRQRRKDRSQKHQALSVRSQFHAPRQTRLGFLLFRLCV